MSLKPAAFAIARVGSLRVRYGILLAQKHQAQSVSQVMEKKTMGKIFPASASESFASIFVTLVVAVVIILGPVHVVHAVTNIADGDVSGLIDAITASNVSDETIDLAAGGSYVLLSTIPSDVGPTGLPTIFGNVTINGNGAKIERDGGAQSFRIFHIDQTGSLTLSNITISGGLAQGGNGTAGGGAGAGMGGAFFNQGILNITGGVLYHNQAIGGDGGGCGDPSPNCFSGGGGGGGLGGNGGFASTGGGGGGGGGSQGDGSNGAQFGFPPRGGAGGPGGGGQGGKAFSDPGQPGSFGGGGGGAGGGSCSKCGVGGNGGAGGFGGGGGRGSFNGTDGGAGGFGGGGGGGGGDNPGGTGGFGGGDGGPGGGRDGGGGGGLGGGGVIFNQFGMVNLTNTIMTDNEVQGGSGGSAIFIGQGSIGMDGEGLGPNIFNNGGIVMLTDSTADDIFNNGGSVIEEMAPVPGDIDGDDDVDQDDLGIVVNCFGQFVADNPDCAIADVAPPPDGDGIINILDISFVGSNFTP